MKKNRPGTHLQTLCALGGEGLLAKIIFSQSSSIGVRFRESERLVLPRSACEITTPWGPLKAKKIVRPGNKIEVQAEFEAARELAGKTGLPLRQILSAACHWE